MKETPGLIVAAPASNNGKTTVTLALLRALADRGVGVASIKAGPDYIDPAFHAAASARPCPNLDLWAMRPGTVSTLAVEAGRGADLLIAEGVMGLFDGAAGGGGSTADLAAVSGWPVVLVVDVKGQGESAAALVQGFAGYRDDVDLAGVIFNRVGKGKHEDILRRALEPSGIPVLGCLPDRSDLVLPDRHLGLVQAAENPDLDAFLGRASAWIAGHVDLGALVGLARPGRFKETKPEIPIPPLGQRIAVAADRAFAFSYPHMLEGWRRAGAEILPFSPLENEAPDGLADAVYLPGGYPELHAGRLAANDTFLAGLNSAPLVYGECGGYMVLGRGLIDADGTRHAMAGLLGLETSFAERCLHLGYRAGKTLVDTPLGRAGTSYRGHEFHYATTIKEEGEPLFACKDSGGIGLGDCGLRTGRTFGSFLHLIDRNAP